MFKENRQITLFMYQKYITSKNYGLHIDILIWFNENSIPNMCCQLIESSKIDVVPKTRKLCGLNRCVSAYTNDSNTNGINGMYRSCMEVGK